jgi:ATP-dependent RNA helicase RhlB
LKFTELDLEPVLLRAVEEVGFETCTPIQRESLPLALAGADVAGQAQTGTGKTAAFLLALMNRLLRSEQARAVREPSAATASDDAGEGRARSGPSYPQAVVLAPTRELALQIHADALVLGKHAGLRMGVVFGGTGYQEQQDMLRAGIDVLIGTPGRLIDFFKQRLFDFRAVEVVVLDEADRMFDLGFIKDIRYVLRRMPAATQRLNLLFSATLSYRVVELAYEHMNNPRIVNVTPERVTVEEVSQTLYHVSKEEKIPLLLGLLQAKDQTRTIVFVNTKGGAERVQRYLEANGHHAGLLSGDVPQRKRMQLLAQFLSGGLPILVATDVAARGLHIPDVSHVYNFDLPQDREDYVHRIGRTARAGATGTAVSFACEEYVFSLEDIESYIKQSIPTVQVTDELLVTPVPPKRLPRRAKTGTREHGRGDGRGRRGGGPHRRSSMAADVPRAPEGGASAAD